MRQLVNTGIQSLQWDRSIVADEIIKELRELARPLLERFSQWIQFVLKA